MASFLSNNQNTPRKVRHDYSHSVLTGCKAATVATPVWTSIARGHGPVAIPGSTTRRGPRVKAAPEKIVVLSSSDNEAK